MSQSRGALAADVSRPAHVKDAVERARKDLGAIGV